MQKTYQGNGYKTSFSVVEWGDEQLGEIQENAGLRMAYLLTKKNSIYDPILRVRSNWDEENGGLWHITLKGSRLSYYSTLEHFIKTFDTKYFDYWELQCYYKGANVTIKGNRGTTRIYASYPTKTPIDIMPLLDDIELELIILAEDMARVENVA